MPPDLSPLVPWLGHADFVALAVGAAVAPDDDAPRLVLVDWLRDHDDEEAAELVAGSRGVFGGWLAMLWYERRTGQSAEADMPHLTALFSPEYKNSLAEDTKRAARQAAADVIFKRAEGWLPTKLRS
jgi:uncharacterized protein (TIGR02996 family)